MSTANKKAKSSDVNVERDVSLLLQDAIANASAQSPFGAGGPAAPPPAAPPASSSNSSTSSSSSYVKKDVSLLLQDEGSALAEGVV